jgi:Dolichyl-phosphate-mannose-protein mannosyltransferase
VNAVATRAADGVRERTLADRFLAAVPLLSVFFWLGVLYTWEAWGHGSPWLFGDELELTQLSRAIADTGHAARRGDPYTFKTLYTYLMAPAWLGDDVHRAYDTIRYVGVIVMTLTVFPAYGIARMIVGKWPALFAAAGAAAIPAMAYSPMIVEEPLAYPYATLTLYLILRALTTRRWTWITAAVLASVIGFWVRDELVVLLPVLALGAGFLWASGRWRSWRSSWDWRDWIGFAVLLIGGGIAVSAFVGHHYTEWLISTGFYKHRMFTFGLRAAGAFTIGLGVFPLVAGLASLWPVRGEQRPRELVVFRSVLAAAVVTFGIYTAVKATYVSTVFGTYTYERNLIYLAPLLFAGTALWLERRAVNVIGVAVAAAFALYVILTTGYEMAQDSSYNAPGLAVLQQGNRWIALTPTGAKIVLVVALVVTVAVLVAPRYLGRSALLLAGAVAAVVVAWNITGEIGFALASNRTSNHALSNIRGNPGWVDRATGGAPTLFLGQQMSPDQNSEWLLEFWNRSIRAVWSLDGTAQGPGPTLTPDMRATDGVLYEANAVKPDFPYVVTDRGIDVAGRIVARHAHRAGGGFSTWRLYRVTEPLRLSGASTGLYSDGWSGAGPAAYTRYFTRGGRAGKLIVSASWKRWGGTNKARVVVRMGELRIGKDKQPHLGRVTEIRRCTLRAHATCRWAIPTPGPKFRVESTVTPGFRPQKLSDSSDQRLLGAVFDYRFIEPRRTGR